MKTSTAINTNRNNERPNDPREPTPVKILSSNPTTIAQRVCSSVTTSVMYTRRAPIFLRFSAKQPRVCTITRSSTKTKNDENYRAVTSPNPNIPVRVLNSVSVLTRTGTYIRIFSFFSENSYGAVRVIASLFRIYRNVHFIRFGVRFVIRYTCATFINKSAGTRVYYSS